MTAELGRRLCLHRSSAAQTLNSQRLQTYSAVVLFLLSKRLTRLTGLLLRTSICGSNSSLASADLRETATAGAAA